MEEHRVRSGDVDLAVYVAGKGPSVLMVHGFPDDHEVWKEQVSALVAAGYQVIAPDTRGCGQSTIASAVSDYHIKLLIGDMIAVLDHFGLERASLVAHDWGAMIAWRLVIAHPDRFERYAALSVGHPAALSAGGKMQMLKSYYIFLFQYRRLGEWMLRGLNWRRVRRMYKSHEEAKQAVARLSRPGYLTAGINYYRANMRMFGQRNVPNCKNMPVLGIASDKDPYISDQALRETARFVDGTYRFEIVHGAGHWLQRDAPEAVNALLLDFLGATSPD
jgi:pimeloyl-ACP methyl ester carboxylesterase